MAKISGIQSGLRVTESTEAPRTVAKPKLDKPAYGQYSCAACGAHWLDKTKFASKYMHDDEAFCRHCMVFFYGIGDLGIGCTNATHEEAQRKLEQLRQLKFVIILRELHLGTGDGRSLHIGAGDIFPVELVPDEPKDGEPPSKDRTWGAFMVSLRVGPYQCKLYPHEWSPMSFLTVMELKKAGEIVESFVATNDQNGHFTPTPEMKAKIDALFGGLTGAR